MLALVGPRFDELGGSEYYRVRGLGLGAHVPQVRYDVERGIIYGTIEAIDQGLVAAAHDISGGGLLIAAAEMLLATHPAESTGLEIHLDALQSPLRVDTQLFSESSGMLFEVALDRLEALRRLFHRYKLEVFELGRVMADRRLVVKHPAGQTLVDLPVEEMRSAWRGPFALTLAT